MQQTPFVFVDTEAFHAARFGFDGGSLKRLLELTKAGRLRMILPTSTRRELHKKLSEQVDDFVSAVRSASKKAPALRGSADPAVSMAFADRDSDAVKAEAAAFLDAYLAEAGVEDLSPPSDSLDTLLDRYFNQEPPFGRGKKQHEFLDALAVHTVARWCQEQEVKAYVVSRDPDLAAACSTEEDLLHVETLADLFSFVEAVDARALSLVESSVDEIERQISLQLEGAGFMLIEEDGDVENVEVQGIEIERLRVQAVEDDVVLFQVEATATIRADVSYWDYSSAIYDSEDKVLLPLHQVEQRVEDEIDFVAYGSLFAQSEKLEDVRELLVDFDTGQTFKVDPHKEYYDEY